MNLDKGTKVASSGQITFTGKVVSECAYDCTVEGCRGKRVSVRWEDGKLTKPCSVGLIPFGEGVRISQ